MFPISNWYFKLVEWCMTGASIIKFLIFLYIVLPLGLFVLLLLPIDAILTIGNYSSKQEEQEDEEDEEDDDDENTIRVNIIIEDNTGLTNNSNNNTRRRRHRRIYQSKENKRLEDEMDMYGLDDEEKDLVRNGNYDPYDFDQEGDLGEFDYYNDDDDE